MQFTLDELKILYADSQIEGAMLRREVAKRDKEIARLKNDLDRMASALPAEVNGTAHGE